MSFMYAPLEKCYSEKLDKWFGGKDCLYEFNPGKFVMPPEYSSIAQDILEFDVRPDDTWLISYSRTGTFLFIIYLSSVIIIINLLFFALIDCTKHYY